jgi:hypothetical protein
VTISHDGVLKMSKSFNILHTGELGAVLGGLQYVLETTASMSPNQTPEKNSSGDSEQCVGSSADADEPMQLDERALDEDDEDEDV